MQNDALGHDTPLRDDVVPYWLGMVHDWPFHCEIPPEADMQNDEDTHEIDDTDPQSPLVPCHPWPSNPKASPCASTAAQYPVGVHPTASSPLAPSSVVGADQVAPFQVTTWLPAVATAVHEVALEHETEMAPGPMAWPVAGAGADHAVPSKW